MYKHSGNFDCWEETDALVRACRHIEAYLDGPLTVHDSRQFVWRSTEGLAEEVFRVTLDGTKSNKYRLCFQSLPLSKEEEEEMDDDQFPNSLQLGFNFRILPAVQRSLPDVELGPDALRAVQLLEDASNAEQHWHHLVDHFDFLRNREAIHAKLMSQTSSKVVGWSIVEALLVITMAIAQVCYWKSFFEQRRYL
jgi:emp24/gp25L/p24 family/GOLD